MNIEVAKSAGFCFGVDRAIKMVYEEIEKGGKVATFGPIIHNKNVVSDLEKKNVRIVDDLSELNSDERLILRSHGVGKDVYVGGLCRMGLPRFARCQVPALAAAGR